MKASLSIRASGACGRSEMVAARCLLALVFSGFPVVPSGLRGVRYHGWANQVTLGFRSGQLHGGAIREALRRLDLSEDSVCLFVLHATGLQVAFFTPRAALLTRWAAATGCSPIRSDYLHLRHKLP